ncbi:glycogen/starch/alpha-glucan phosphorylase [uncultured Fusobacterium sp.]|uniref:glycogen/starch/alpha-glucan phosphorylase n=1 Tax=uncultured Fusobacterium sp. TaxID=159267 RepID=UPI0025EA7170|nr:glycogen/starch/alpha-glucan phosphorylase [uncultured Fusobacterium sp.]
MQRLEKIAKANYGKALRECSNNEAYYALLEMVKVITAEKEEIKGDKKVYYISAEFLIGKLLSNNLINLGIYDKVAEYLKENGKDITEIEEVEPEPSLGNGGLGRLAACFLDSIATLGLAGDGIGLNYHYGLFKQVFRNNLQNEEKNPWIEKDSWLNKTDISFDVEFGDFSVKSRLYDIDVIGYNNGKNKLHLFDIETIDESMVKEGIKFDKEEIAKNLTLFLYPDDSDEAGHLLRIYQQYFMVSNGTQYILKEAKDRGVDLHKLNEHVTIQINDTHPTMVIPELIRLLMKEGIHMSEAVKIVVKTCAYTNHTILAEALEKWPVRYLKKVVPQLIPIIEALNAIISEKYSDERVQIIDRYDNVHMANIDIHFGYSTNGVAALHTDILKNSELKPFYDIYPERFNNKTNGITFRRWLMHCNHELTAFIDKLIGEGYKKDALELEKLGAFIDNNEVLAELDGIKKLKKKHLREFLKKSQGVEIDENSIFDIQIKRLHEYKRQQLNVLYIIYKYLEIKKGHCPTTPITFIFGAKAAPAYVIAKDIIHLILSLQELINNDPVASRYIKVVMVENYNVSKAEKLIPACDVSEQISLASKEASGTGNMKFMLNGAVTLGTMDGANVEIAQLVGDENIYIFGESSDSVIKHYEKRDYISRDYYEKPMIKELVDFITGEELLNIGNRENLERVKNELVNKDWFMTLLDLEDYIKVKNEIFKAYEDRERWLKMSLTNISKAGFFSSDRTIADYNRDIWKLK